MVERNDLLVAPVLEKGATMRKVLLPPGKSGGLPLAVKECSPAVIPDCIRDLSFSINGPSSPDPYFPSSPAAASREALITLSMSKYL